MKIINDGRRNPLIVVEPDDVIAFLRAKADEAGFADRALSAIQVRGTYEGAPAIMYEGLEITLMVSNVKNSRAT